MSDELIEGRSLRRMTSLPPSEPPPAPARKRRVEPKAEDEPSGPYVALEPPPEAGNVIRDQGDQPTYHRKLKPVLIEEGKAPAEAAADEPEDADSSAPAADLPWEVFEGAVEEQPAAAPPPMPAAASLPEPDSQPIMRLPKVESTPPETAPSVPESKRDADFVPEFHTPTGALPAVNTDPDNFIPELHTPTGALPAVDADDDDLPAAPPPIQRGSRRRRVAAEEDEPSSRHTPGVMRPVENDDDEIAELYRKPDDEPLARRRLDEPSGEIVDAEWVREVGGRGEDINDRIEARLREKRQPTREPAPARPANLRTILLVGGSALIILAAALIRLWPVLFGGGVLPPASALPPGETPILVASAPATDDGAATAAPSTEAPVAGEGHQQGRLAFSSNRDGNYEIYVMAMANGKMTRLTNRAPADRFPAWSPDGKRLVFVSDAGQNDDLWLIPASGGEPLQLTTDPGSDRNPAWSPDGSEILFSREGVEGSRLMSLPAACLSAPETCEGLLTVLTPGGYDRFPAWSPDGSRLAFSASDLPGGASVVALLNSDGSGYEALAGTGTSDFGPMWSPDGARIAFVSYARGDYDVWIMGADGGALAQITRNSSTDTSPAWSPDGGWLAFASDRGAQANFHLFVAPLDCVASATCEDALIQLTDTAGIDDLDPAWAK